MNRSFPLTHFVHGALAVVLACVSLRAEDAPQSTLETAPSARGTFTHWLVAPAQKLPVEQLTAAPARVREGAPAQSGGAWKLKISETDFVDLRDEAYGLRQGAVWCYGKLKTSGGGKRRISGYAFAPLRIFVGGKLVVDKPQSPGERADGKGAVIELAKDEEVEIAVACGMRYGCNFALTVTLDEKLSAVPGDRIVLPLVAGGASAALALTRSVAFSSDVSFLSPGRACELSVELRGGWPTGLGKVLPRFFDPLGKEIEATFEARTPEELAVKAFRVRFNAPQDLPPASAIRCELLDAQDKQVLGSRSLRVYAVDAIQKESGRLSEELTKATALAKRPFPHAALALEKIGIWFEQLAAGDMRLSEEIGATLTGLLEDARSALKSEVLGQDLHAGRVGYFERAYWSTLDESAQPYFVGVPSAAKDEISKPKDQAQKFPLVIFLHGYVPDYHKHRWWAEMPEFNAVFERQSCFLCIPFGRSNADFVGCGEVDVLATVEEMKKAYPIDEDRVYLYGYSMGGMGVYTLGAHYPDPWAAAVVTAGRADSPLLMKTKGLESLHPFKQWIIRADHPIDLCENFLNIPTRIYHGSEDQVVHPDDARRMEKRLKESGCDVRLEFRPGDHWFGFDLMAEDKPVQWLLQQKRNTKPLAHATLKSFSLRFGSAHGATVNHMRGELAPLRVEWELREDLAGVGAKGKQLKVKSISEPVAELWFDAGRLPAALSADEKIDGWEGRVLCKPNEEASPFARVFSRQDWAAKNHAQQVMVEWKNLNRTGPIKEATYSPFLVAYGTTGSIEKNKESKESALRFARDWYEFAKGKAQVKADTAVTEADFKTHNLFIFGEESNNALHAQAAATGKLPFKVNEGKVQIGGKTVDLKGRGFMAIYPNPIAGAGLDRSIVICVGLNYGAHLSPNHKLDLLPDFLLYSADPDHDGTQTNKPVCAGFFDGKWKLDPKLMWWFE